MTETQSTEAWPLDRRFPVALIMTILVQTFVAGMAWASLSARVEQHERQIAALLASDAQMQGEARRIAEYLARMDERLGAQTELLRRVEQAVRNGR